MHIMRTAAIRRLENEYIPHANPPLMERAGKAAAELTRLILADHAHPLRNSILILAGPGNNGGDAYVAARYLHQQGISVVLVAFPSNKPLPADAENARAAWLACGGQIQNTLPPLAAYARDTYALAIDGLLGIGLTRAVEGELAIWINYLNTLQCPVVAIDVPSGLDADTGRIMGCAVHASHTITFLTLKPGLITLDGPDHAGEIHCTTLEINATHHAQGEGQLITRQTFEHALHPRQSNSHKGSFGSVAIIGGSSGMAGAALLSGRAALKLGAGRVYVGMLTPLSLDPLQPELMLRECLDAITQSTVIGIGPGLGQSAEALAILRHAVAKDAPLVVDADALNLLALHPVIAANIARRSAPTFMTPHPAEAARLLGVDTATVQADRVASALQLAQRFNASIVLKGNGSVIATATGDWYINTTGNAGLATAGSGDVLLGMTSALLAQGVTPDIALPTAVYLHGAAADELVTSGIGPVGMTAGELIDAARKLWNQWLMESR